MDAPPIQYCRSEDGTNIAWWSLGEGPPVLVPIGIFVSHIALEWEVPSFRRYYQGLAETFQVIRFDSRCSGLSDEGDLTVDGFAADIAAVADVMGLERMALVSSEAGIAYTSAFLQRYPTRVSCTVALNPRIHSVGSGGGVDTFAKIRETLPERLTEITAAFTDPRGVDPRPPVERWLGESLKVTMQTPMDRWTQFQQEVGIGEARGLQPPLLVVDYPENGFSEGPQLARLVPGARLVARPGRGGPVWNSDLEGLIALIREFVLEHAGAAGAGRPARAASPRPATAGVNLSPRELEVLGLIAAGKSNPEIAEVLVIAPGTVGRHVSNLLGKTGLRNRVELTRYASDHGLTGS